MDDLLEIEVAVPYMAEVLAEVFTGGPEICLKVREDQVERVFQLMVNSGEEGRAEHIGVLLAMAKVVTIIYTGHNLNNCISTFKHIKCCDVYTI